MHLRTRAQGDALAAMNYRNNSREDPRRSALFDIDEENSHTGEDFSVDLSDGATLCFF